MQCHDNKRERKTNRLTGGHTRKETDGLANLSQVERVRESTTDSRDKKNYQI